MLEKKIHYINNEEVLLRVAEKKNLELSRLLTKGSTRYSTPGCQYFYRKKKKKESCVNFL